MPNKFEHVCGKGCNGDLHGELIAEPPDGGLNLLTLQRWLDARSIQSNAFEIFAKGGMKKYIAVVWE